MPNSNLQRNQAPLPNILKTTGFPECMSAQLFAKQKGAILHQIRTRTDPPPRLMRSGTGSPANHHADLRKLLAERPDAVLVRGFKLLHIPVDLRHWGQPAWLAETHMVVATVTESGNVVYVDPTTSMDPEYVFVPSDRAHRDLTTEQLLSGHWITGNVVGGHPRFCQALVIHERAHGRRRSVVATTPEELVAKRRVLVHPMPHFVEWYQERGYTNGVETQAEMMGAAVFDVDDRPEDDIADVLTMYNAVTKNPEAYVDGVTGLQLELKCQNKLMKGELGVYEVKEMFFAYFDNTARLVLAEQTRWLLARLEEGGFNTLYS